MMPRHAARIACALAAALIGSAVVLARSGAQEAVLTRLADQVVGHVRDHFFDSDRAAAWSERNADYARGIADRATFVLRTRKVLAELNTSHTGYYTSDDPEFHSLRAIFGGPAPGPFPAQGVRGFRTETIGLDVGPDGFVRRVFAAGPAVGAGVARGDQILSADGAPFHPVLSLRGKAGRPVTLLVQSEPGGPTRPVEIIVQSVPLEALWLAHQRAGTHIVQTPAGKKALLVPYYCGAGEEFTSALEEAILTRQAEADAMVLDARGGWGGSPPDLIARFDRAVPTLRVAQRGQPAAEIHSRWRKPFVVVIDSGTRSGKEVFAFAVKASRRGRLVGRTTSGSVLAGRPFWLADGSLLFLAVADVEVDGKHIEGIGVAPDVEVPDDLPYAQGRDAALDTALREADSQIAAEALTR